MKKYHLLIIILFFLSSINVYGWGSKGHSIIAQIAFDNVSEKTKNKISLYLHGMSAEQAGNWMDDMRSNKIYSYMRPYHFANFSKGEDVKLINGANIISVLAESINLLHNNKITDPKDITNRLLFLFHLIGDLHQPLHVGYGEDKGGNKAQVQFNNKGTNLHTLWDRGIIDYKNLTLAECMSISSYVNRKKINYQNGDVLHWARESRSYLDKIYLVGNNKIDEQYVNFSFPIIREQLVKAGLRLAAVLEYCCSNLPYLFIKEQGNEKENIINVTDADKYEGKKVKICSKIFDGKYFAKSPKKHTLLNVGANYPAAPLTLIIFGESRSNFKQAPEIYYPGKSFCISGIIQLYRGKPQIVVSHEKDIQIQ